MKRLISMLLVVVMSVALFGCAKAPAETPAAAAPAEAPADAPAAEATEKKDSLVISLQTELQTLNVMAQQNIVTNEVLINIYEGLVKLAQDASIVGNLAESWEWNADECKYTFKLKQGVKFHDGSDFTAKDVKFSFDVVQGEFASYQASIATVLDRAEIVDDYTVDVYLKAPSAAFLYNLATQMKIICADAFESTNKYTEGIVATGPYKLVSYDPTVGVELEAFDDYHGDIKPSIKHVTFKIIPDANTQVLALQNNELNISRDFPASAIATIEADENLDIFSHDCGMIYFLQFNLRENAIPELKDQRVRQAINYCLDKEAMIIVGEEGNGVASRSIASKVASGYGDNIPAYDRDVEKAKALMKEAGYENGFDIGKLICREGKDQKVAEIALGNLAEIGITCTIETVENNAYMDIAKSGTYTVCATHLNLGPDGSQTFEASSIRGAVPYSGLEDPVIEAARDAADLEMDSAKRTAILNEYLVYLGDQAYFAPCYYPQKSYAHTAGLEFTGFDPFTGMQVAMIKWAD